jgi:hypothetical protein
MKSHTVDVEEGSLCEFTRADQAVTDGGQIGIEDLPWRLQDMARRVRDHRPSLRLCNAIPAVRLAFETIWWDVIEGKLALGDLTIDADREDVIDIFAAVGMPIVDLSGVKGVRVL